MRLVWHIAAKDLRRLTLPLIAWLAMVVAPTIALLVASPTIDGHVVSGIDAWRSGFSAWIQMLLGVQFFIGFVLTGALVLEDPLMGTDSFWLTRPISRMRLLLGKLLGATLMFIALPAVALLPVWLWSGFGVSDLGQAMWVLVTRFGVPVLSALMIASLVRNLAQFLLCSLVLVGVFSVIPPLVSMSPLWQSAPSAVLRSREALAIAVALATLLFVLVQQFLTRRRARAWVTLTTALIIIVVVRCCWPWDMESDRETASNPRMAEVLVDAAFSKSRVESNEAPNLFGTTTWVAEDFLVPVFAKLPDETVVMRSSGVWETEAGLRALGLKGNTTPLRWQLTLNGSAPNAGGELSLNGTLEVWSVRTRVLGEMPLRVGAKLAVGAARIRILDLGWHDDRLDVIYIEEHDTFTASRGDWSNHWLDYTGERVRYIDQYFVVNRATGKAQSARLGDFGAVEMNSVLARYRTLGVTWQREWGDAVLIKLRFECVQRFDRPLEVRGLTFTRPDPKS